MQLSLWNFGLGQADDLIEKYESFIWTDRYAGHGDFQIVMAVNAENLAKFTPDTIIGFDLSDRLMVVESATKTTGSEGQTSLTVKGRSLEALLDGRVARSALSSSIWTLTGGAGAIVASMVNTVCVAGTGISSDDIIPGMTSANLVTGEASISVGIKPASLYVVIKELCDSYNYGFRIRRIVDPDVAHGGAVVAFEVYTGNDLSGQWGVSFSENLENLSQMAYFNSKAEFKNVAYVFAPNGSRIVTATGASAVSGLSRKVLLVDATDVTTAAGTTLQAQLLQRGLDALSMHLELKLVDGLINQYSAVYEFNVDYFMGDIVDIVGDNKQHTPMRVTEYIWAHDTTGFTSYPTLAVTGGV